MNQTGTKRLTIILSVVMVVALLGGTLSQMFTNNVTSSATNAAPTDPPKPTFPSPLQNFQTIKFDTDYLHPSGLFSVAEPTGYTLGQPVSSADGAEITMNNSDLLSVIQVSLRVPPTPVKSLDDLNAIFTTAALNQSWSNYRNPKETARRKEGDKLIIDFELQNTRDQTFVARQSSWTDGDWVYSVRVVTPENAIDFLKFMVDALTPTIKGNKALFAGTPTDWKAYFDQTTNYILRYPSDWVLADSAPGLPASIQGSNVLLRVETQVGKTIADEANARAWLDADRPGAKILTVKPAAHGDLKGFSVTYTYQTVDGDMQSGAALLMNGADKSLHVANLRLFKPDVDLNSDAAKETYGDLVKVLNSFQTLPPGLKLPPPPTPTPLPTLAPSPTAAPTEATPEATAKAEVTAEATATVVPPTAVPTTAVPTTAVPTTRVPTTAAPTSTSVPPTATATPTNTATAEATAEATKAG